MPLLSLKKKSSCQKSLIERYGLCVKNKQQKNTCSHLLPTLCSSLLTILLIITTTIIIMYIYHAFINALSAHTIHINLNTIFYTHVEHSPTKTIYERYYMETRTRTHIYTHTHARTLARTRTHARTHTHTHTHTHIDCSRNWILILVGAEIL